MDPRPLIPLRALAVGALVVVAACGGGTGPPASSGSPAPCRPAGVVSVGEPIPGSCSFERIEGGVLKLADLRGTPAVINFWASWCTFCIEEMPAFQKVFAALGGRVIFVGADLLGVQGETRAAAGSFARSTGVRYPLIYDEGGLLYAHFSARLVMPVTVFVRADGVVAHRRFGPLTEKQIRDLVRTHLRVS